MEPQTRAHQLLPQIATLIGIDLGARIIEELVFNKRAELRIPIVICAGNNLPREVRVTSTSARVKGTVGTLELRTRGFRIINANPRSDIRLESSKRESPDEVPHKRASVNPGSQTAGSQYITIGFPQGEVGATPKPIVKEVPFNGRAKYACAKDVPEFEAAESPDVIFRADSESISELIAKNLGSAAVLVDIRSAVNRPVKTGSVNLRWRRWRDLLVFLRRSGK